MLCVVYNLPSFREMGSTKPLSNETKWFCAIEKSILRHFEEGIHDEGIKSATGHWFHDDGHFQSILPTNYRPHPPPPFLLSSTSTLLCQLLSWLPRRALFPILSKLQIVLTLIPLNLLFSCELSCPWIVLSEPTSCMNFLQTGRISFESVAENIMTCFSWGVLRKISWTSRLISGKKGREMLFVYFESTNLNSFC